MGGITVFETIFRAVEISLVDSDIRRQTLIDELDTSGSTVLINAIRSIDMQSALLAIGALSMLESVLSNEQGLPEPLSMIKEKLNENGNSELGANFEAFRLAINVLKHGEGRSYDALLNWKGDLPFRVKPRADNFFEEGDVSEVPSLIETSPSFARDCAELVLEIARDLRLA